jgi:hypothetical protein
MLRLLVVSVLIGSCFQSVAAEPTPRHDAPRYVAKIKCRLVNDGRQLIAVDTDVTGAKGTPLQTVLGSKDGLVLKLQMRDVPGGASSMYVAELTLIETKGGKEFVRSHPTIATVEGEPAMLKIGGLEVELVVRPVEAQPK